MRTYDNNTQNAILFGKSKSEGSQKDISYTILGKIAEHRSSPKGKEGEWRERSCWFCSLFHGQYLWQCLRKGLHKDLMKKLFWQKVGGWTLKSEGWWRGLDLQLFSSVSLDTTYIMHYIQIHKNQALVTPISLWWLKDTICLRCSVHDCRPSILGFPSLVLQ